MNPNLINLWNFTIIHAPLALWFRTFSSIVNLSWIMMSNKQILMYLNFGCMISWSHTLVADLCNKNYLQLKLSPKCHPLPWINHTRNWTLSSLQVLSTIYWFRRKKNYIAVCKIFHSELSSMWYACGIYHVCIFQLFLLFLIILFLALLTLLALMCTYFSTI